MSVTIDGTNTPTAGGIGYGDGTELAFTSAGTSGQVLQSNGSGAPTWVASPATNPAGSTGQVQYNNAGSFGAISSGTSGQVLTSAGSGAAPTWTSPSAGAMTLISTQNVTGVSAVEWTNLSGYNNYQIFFTDLYGGSGARNLYMQIGYGGSSTTYLTSNYRYLCNQVYRSAIGSTSQNVVANVLDSAFFLDGSSQDVSTSAENGISGIITLTNMLASFGNNKFNGTAIIGGDGYGNGNGGAMENNVIVFNHSNTNAKTAIKFYISSTSSITGSFSLYGISS